MTEEPDVTLMDAARLYLDGLSDEGRIACQAEVERFVRWCGADRPIGQLRGHEVATYAETLTGTVTDASARANAVRKFLSGAKKAGMTKTNMGTHLRVKKTTAKKAARAAPPLEEIEMSEQEKAALLTELESLKGQRPKIIEDIQRARADKDFRENAPLDAAREQQGHVEGRIRQLELMIDQAVIVVAGSRSGSAVEIGSTVVLVNLRSEVETTYTLVRPGEVDAAKGRISFESPVGQALLLKGAGDEVEVTAPSGTLRFRIERVEG